MASTLLSLLHEYLIPRVPYCQRPPLVYLELGYGNSGPTCVYLVIGLTKPMSSDPLVENFVKLCRGERDFNGEPLSYKGNPVELLDSLNGIIVLGEVLLATGQRGGRAATDTGLVQMTSLSEKPEDVPPGTVIMLPCDLSSNEFTSVFCVTMQRQTIYEGEVIGHVEEGLDELNKLLLECGSQRGRPTAAVIVQSCGQL